jgi:hypothetical protein
MDRRHGPAAMPIRTMKPHSSLGRLCVSQFHRRRPWTARGGEDGEDEELSSEEAQSEIDDLRAWIDTNC